MACKRGFCSHAINGCLRSACLASYLRLSRDTAGVGVELQGAQTSQPYVERRAAHRFYAGSSSFASCRCTLLLRHQPRSADWAGNAQIQTGEGKTRRGNSRCGAHTETCEAACSEGLICMHHIMSMASMKANASACPFRGQAKV